MGVKPKNTTPKLVNFKTSVFEKINTEADARKTSGNDIIETIVERVLFNDELKEKILG